MLELDIGSRLAELRSEYQVDNRVNISNVWKNNGAETLLDALSNQTEFDHALHANGSSIRLTDSQLKGMSNQERQQMHQSMMNHAAQGVGFLYNSHLLGRQYSKPTPQLIKQAHTLLNTAEVLNTIKELTGHQDIIYASAQATRYLPGHFLTRHNDVYEQEGRRVAFVMGFTPRWHPDWGGLLHFYKQDGSLTDTWVPRFNNMVLFDVKHPHSVSYVSPFAQGARYSITGWFRAIKP
ncbi:2OG-Fe(II) oxygenase [Shewanella corallii]|uniref:2OG-Fe(II) oxygenase n=1 Tax=Shewanella corallii TaxID=560080 RepID=A0ABT0NA38_9GAMM|nr:2OG-Fe(II) oxygenase family protein [Shewanella corallii]MCL2915288.1 2OG-Fe(II) oxygenase [Shewanella corallii]